MAEKHEEKQIEKHPEDVFWLVDYLDSHSVCDLYEELGFIWQ